MKYRTSTCLDPCLMSGMRKRRWNCEEGCLSWSRKKSISSFIEMLNTTKIATLYSHSNYVNRKVVWICLSSKAHECQHNLLLGKLATRLVELYILLPEHVLPTNVITYRSLGCGLSAHVCQKYKDRDHTRCNVSNIATTPFGLFGEVCTC